MFAKAAVIGGALGNLLWCFRWNYESNYSRPVEILFIGPQPFREKHPSPATTAHRSTRTDSRIEWIKRTRPVPLSERRGGH